MASNLTFATVKGEFITTSNLIQTGASKFIMASN